MTSQPAIAPHRWEIVIHWDAGLTTKNRRMHPLKRYRLTEVAKQTAWGAWASQGKPVANGRVRLSITILRARRLDEANVMSGLDGLIDGIFAMKRYNGRPVERGFCTVDDSPEYLTIGDVLQEIGPQFRRAEQVVFTIEEV